MATKIQAINAYRPKVKLGKRAEMDEIVEFIARSTGLNESGVRQALLELRDAVLFFNRRGQAVKLEGLGTYSPSIGLDGVFDVAHRADVAIKNGLNEADSFRGEIVNRENVGKSGDDLVALWNAAHPDDQVTG